MIVGAVTGLFEGFAKMILILVLIILCLMGIGTYYLNQHKNDNIHRVNKLVKPITEINSKTINGITTSDTIYIYDFNDK